MLITDANDYATRSLVFLAKQPKKKAIPTKYIASELRIPYTFLAKIFQKLVKKGFIVTLKGPHGGVMLKNKAENKSLKQIFQAIDGVPVLRKCLNDSKTCFLSNNCTINSLLIKIQTKMNHEFKKVTLADLTAASYKY